MLTLTLPDNSTKSVPPGTTVAEVAALIGPRLAKDAVAGKVDGKLVDTAFKLGKDASFAIITPKSPEAAELLRHSAAHLMAQAVQRLYGPAKLWVGPPLMEGRYGFYYDMDLERRITEEDLRKIEAEMEKIAQEDLKPVRIEMPVEEAVREMEKADQPYKVELIRKFGVPTVSFYRQGEFIDLCEGPHVPRTGVFGGLKLLAVTGAYLHGNQDEKMLQRVYGCAFFTRKELDAHLQKWVDAEKNDHRRLGTDLDLYSLDAIAPGSPFFHPKGAVLYNTLIDTLRGLYARYGYDEVITPLIFKTDLWKTSGHYEAFRNDMFMLKAEDAEYGVKPMNCPGHCVLYATRRHSYRELPIRYAEFSRLHRFEKSGVMHGLTRVRSFAQDDAHIFCAADQIEEEFGRFLEMTREVYRMLGLGQPEIAIATCPPNYLGTPEMKEKAESALKNGLEKAGLPFTINAGQGAHYAPKVEFNFRDVLDRAWTLGTIQVDFVLPSRFELGYMAADGKLAAPVMLHRAILGSLERFIGIYVEHTGGRFPLWIAPEQVRVMTITDREIPAAEKVAKVLREKGLRVGTDFRGEKVNSKIRDASLQKIPAMAILGAREAGTGAVAVRDRDQGDRGVMPLEGFVTDVMDRIQRRL